MAFRVEHRLGIRADAERIWSLLSDLPGWARWNPVYPQAAGTLAIGANLILTEAIPGQAPRQISPTVVDWVPREQIVWSMQTLPVLARSLRYFEIEELQPGSCILGVGEIFYGVIGEGEAKRRRRALKEASAKICEAVKAQVEV
ncbi:MAG TPA: SRPBCC domain-containing protein [Caulobacteraceae bacterium]|nr:SRPBCC domain-containing protein [Caulobacteraceae bacterium]